MKREEAIEQLKNCKELIKQDGQDYLDERDFPLLEMAIESLSADRPKGEWIDREKGTNGFYQYRWKCSVCGKSTIEITNFCPNCGAIMYKGGDIG